MGNAAAITIVHMSGYGKRGARRIPAALSVRLWGMDANGRPFIEVSQTKNVSRTGALLNGIPRKLAVGEIVGLRCNERKYRFRVVWTGKHGTADAESIGLQSLDPGEWIWDGLRLPADDTDIYARPLQHERRALKRTKCLVSAEVISDRSQKVLAFATNLSAEGCYIPMPYPLPVETQVSIALWLNEQLKIWVDGMVVSSHLQTGMGVKFTSLTKSNSESIQRCVKELSETETSPLV